MCSFFTKRSGDYSSLSTNGRIGANVLDTSNIIEPKIDSKKGYALASNHLWHSLLININYFAAWNLASTTSQFTTFQNAPM